jgi:hypothetical protein
VPENLLGLLKICLLILIYLFFVRVLWAVWSEVRAVRPQTEPGGRPPHDDRAAGPVGAGGAPARARHGAPGVPQQLLIEMPADRRGARFQLSGPELTIGRAGGCHIALPNDTFASTLHARVFERNGAVYVEDLGSTNGTYVNGNRLAAPVVLRPGDRLQVGTTVLEAS